jgi:Flp pilus assembly protein TadD
MKVEPVGTREPWMRTRSSAQVRSVVIASLVAGLALAAGCVVTPRRAESPSPDGQAVAQNDASASQTDPSHPSGSTTDFHAKATDRQRFQVHIDFGRVFETQGNLEAAIHEYQDALTVVENKRHGPFRASDEALAHRRMAAALDRLGRFAQAETHYKKALKQSPKDPKIWNDAGYSYYLQGRWADAERALKTAAKLAPEDERIRVNLGLTLAAQGRTESALPLLSRTGTDATGHANLGYLLASTGQFDLARHQYEEALALRPDLEVAHRALARIALQEQNLPSTGAAPSLMTDRVRSTIHPVDPRVSPVSTASIKIPPPALRRTSPDARATSIVDRPTPTPPSAQIPVPVPFSAPPAL